MRNPGQAARDNLPGKRPKISPWREKPEKVSRRNLLREVRAKYSLLPFSKNFWTAHALTPQSPDSTKRSFLRTNKDTAAKVIANAYGDGKASGRSVSPQNLRRVIDSQLNTFSSSALDDFVSRTRNVISAQEIKNLPEKIEEHLKDYLSARNIPVRTQNERRALRTTVLDLINRGIISDAKASLDLASAERIYFQNRKGLRRLDLDDTERTNKIFRDSFGRERLTANQERATKAWLRAHIGELEDKELALAREYSQKMPLGKTPEDTGKKFVDCINNARKEAGRQFVERARNELFRNFKPPEKAPRKFVPRAGPEKSGTRQQRIADHELTASQKKRRMFNVERTVNLMEKTVNLMGKPFDPVDYALIGIKADNKACASVIERLLQEKALKGDKVIKLFISGSLAQRVFKNVVENKEFMDKFGQNSVDLLATGLSYIGPKGRQTVGVRRIFQGERGKELFDFLEKSGYIDTRHTGANVTYLTRR